MQRPLGGRCITRTPSHATATEDIARHKRAMTQRVLRQDVEVLGLGAVKPRRNSFDQEHEREDNDPTNDSRLPWQ